MAWGERTPSWDVIHKPSITYPLCVFDHILAASFPYKNPPDLASTLRTLVFTGHTKNVITLLNEHWYSSLRKVRLAKRTS
jgi:hypothetical protein